MNSIDEALDEEYVMTWMRLIIADTTLMDNETLAQAFEQLILHLEGHIHTARLIGDAS
jgi:hypothetical protein